MKPHPQTAAEAARPVMQAAGILMGRKWIFLYLLPVSIVLHAEVDMNQRVVIVPYVKQRASTQTGGGEDDSSPF